MTAWRQHPFRVTGRLLWLGAELALAPLIFGLRCLPFPRRSTRASWVHICSRRILRIFRLQPAIHGPIPESGLLISNHLGYLDILVISAIAPAVFVAKRDVKSWPLLGWFAAMGGTVFVHRERRLQVGEVTEEIEAALQDGALVVLFPEGTSSDGRTVLPFRTALLAAAARQTHPLFAAYIHYELDDGDVGEEVCYWKDMTLVPHLVNLASKREVRATVRFARVEGGSRDRKELAREVRERVLRLKEEG
jgi:lyso-ornithine lipid O-acyltransferase